MDTNGVEISNWDSSYLSCSFQRSISHHHDHGRRKPEHHLRIDVQFTASHRPHPREFRIWPRYDPLLHFCCITWNLPPRPLATRIRARELRSSISAGDGKERRQQWECLIEFCQGLSTRVQWIQSRGTVSGAKPIARSGVLPGYTPKIENPGFMATAPSAMPRCRS
jgi:hypothetical protein